MLSSDFLIIGGGIIGLSIAKEINNRHPGSKIIVMEKEGSLARHASGRNSGVLHAGFYYTPDSLKARFTAEGSRLMNEYCLEHDLPINRCGKVVVAAEDNDIETLYELKRRGDSNGVKLEMVDERQLMDIEPNAKTCHMALFSPATAVVNPEKVVNYIGNELMQKKNVEILFNEMFIKRVDGQNAVTASQKISYNYLINTAGQYSDKVAHQFGVGNNYTLIPFKGLYLEYKGDNPLRRHIYPVPDLRNPFLGIHFTKTVEGKVKVGPNSVPALWRENYSGLSNFKISEMLNILSTEAQLFISNRGNFRTLAMSESKKYRKDYFIRQASRLMKKLDTNKFGKWLKPGIRAQLLDKEKMNFVMDFVVEHGENSTHILNAVSPAFTSAFSFSRHVVDEVEKRFN